MLSMSTTIGWYEPKKEWMMLETPEKNRLSFSVHLVFPSIVWNLPGLSQGAISSSWNVNPGIAVIFVTWDCAVAKHAKVYESVWHLFRVLDLA